jgi:hypothetical protein
MLLVHHNWYTSFSVVARLVGGYLSRYYAAVEYATSLPAAASAGRAPDAVVYVHDSIDLLTNPDGYALRGTEATAAWSDTCLDPALYDGLRPFPAPHVAASPANRDMLRPLGVEATLPRTFNADAVRTVLAENLEKEDYFAAVGYVEETDRKNFGQLRDVVERTGIRVRAITNVDGPWERVPYATLDEEEKYRVLARARFLVFLSQGEGFGMPPLEAMSVGTPVVYSDVPAHNGFCVGLPVRTAGPPRAVSATQPGGMPFRATLQRCDGEDAIRQVRRACEMGEAEYAALRREAIEAAAAFHPSVVVESFYRTYLRPGAPSARNGEAPS